MTFVQPIGGPHVDLYDALVERLADRKSKKRKPGGQSTWPGRMWKDKAVLKHDRYTGEVRVYRAGGGILLGEVEVGPEPGSEDMLLGAFVGFLTRNYGEDMSSLNLQFRIPEAAPRQAKKKR